MEVASLETKNVGEEGEVYIGNGTWEERTWKVERGYVLGESSVRRRFRAGLC